MTDSHAGRIEQYGAGYPRFTALLAAHEPWLIVRRFDRLRTRLLLLKQDRLSLLEQQLDQIDQQETAPLFLGQSRCDGNPDRLSTLSQIDLSMADYDQFIERTSRVLSLQSAEGRNTESLKHWVEASGCLARTETEYLSHRGELVSLNPIIDNAIVQLETWVEDKLIRYWGGLSRFHDLSTDPNIYIHSGVLIQRTAKALLFALVILLLMLPVVVCNFISAISARIVIVILSTTSYLVILSSLTKSKTMELILAGATYATVLIVFVSSTNSTQI